MSKSYVERSLEWLREHKFQYSVASWYSAHDRRRHDLLGIFDYVGFAPVIGVDKKEFCLLGIQICGQDFQPHVRKINSSKFARLWIKSENEILLIGWRELKGKGMQPRLKWWQVRGDFPAVSASLNSISGNPKPPLTPDISNL